MLAESEMLLRSRASSARSLGADMWEALVTTSKAKDCRVLAYVRHAFVKIAQIYFNSHSKNPQSNVAHLKNGLKEVRNVRC